MLVEVLLLVVAAALVVACGVFVAAEFSFLAVDRASVDSAVAAGRRGSVGLRAALRSLSTQLSGAQVGITVTNVAIGFLAEPTLGRLLAGPLATVGVPEAASFKIAFTVGLLVATGVTMVFGELVPKNLAIAHPYGVARVVQLPQRWFTTATGLLTRGLNAAANRIVRMMGVEPQEELASARSPQELVSLVRHSAAAGTLEQPTAALVERALRFDDKVAADVLTPRTRMVAVDRDAPVADVVEVARRSGHSRLPVLGDGLDDVVGIVELPAIVGIEPDQRQRRRVDEVMREPLVVPDTLPLDDLLQRLLDGGAAMAVVVDEFGGTAGVVTFEDLVEEIVGDVVDEHDRRRPAIRRSSGGAWVVSGLLRPDEVADATGIHLPESESHETLAGLVLERLGRLPSRGDMVEVDGVRLQVLRMDGHRIDRLRVTPIPREPDREAQR